MRGLICSRSSKALCPCGDGVINPSRMKLSKAVVLLVALLVAWLSMGFARAELPPSAYEAMQAKASEYVEIEALQVAVEPGSTPESQNVEILARVEKVLRTSNKLTADDVIRIQYQVTARPKGWVGPGEIPILREGARTVAYLKPVGNNEYYTTAAGRMSFLNF